MEILNQVKKLKNLILLSTNYYLLLPDIIVKYLKKKFMIFMSCKLRFIISILVKFFGSKINIGDVSKNIHRLIDVLYANSLLSSFYN